MRKFEIPEGKGNINTAYINNNYFILTEDEEKELLQVHKRFNFLLTKQKDSLSQMIRYIIEATYLYLTYKELNFEDDLITILQKDYYKNLDHTFKKSLESRLVKDLIRELVRTQTLHLFSYKNGDVALSNLKRKDDSGEVKEQFRLTKDDENLLRILMGNKVFSNPDFLTALIRYFLASNKVSILYFPISLNLNQAISSKTHIFINNRKYKVYAESNSSYYGRSYLLFDVENNKFITKGIMLLARSKVTPTILPASFSNEEKMLAEAYLNLKTIDISYKLTDKFKDEDDKRYFISEKYRVFRLVFEKKDKDLFTRTFHFSDNLPSIFEKYEKDGLITNLSFSQNYINYIKCKKQYEKD